MPETTPYAQDEAHKHTASLVAAGWRLDDDAGAMTREYRFGGFPAAMAFMSMVACVAEASDHHPEWSNVYNRVNVRLTTHSAKGLTQLDVALAQAMEEIAALHGAK